MRRLPVVLAAATVLLQIAYPLLGGGPLRLVTVATVLCFCAASLSHAWIHRGPAWALGLLAITAAGSFAAEAVGVATGVPFGSYSYAATLGPRALGVPLLVPLAWVMMAYPALLAARRICTCRWAVPLVTAVVLTAWDVALDPQMVAAGHWSWRHPEPALPGVPGIPLTNFAGWLAVSAVLAVLLDRALPDRRADDTVPAALLLWTWLGSVVGNLVFMDRPGVGVWSGVLLGSVAVPLAASVLRTPSLARVSRGHHPPASPRSPGGLARVPRDHGATS